MQRTALLSNLTSKNSLFYLMLLLSSYLFTPTNVIAQSERGIKIKGVEFGTGLRLTSFNGSTPRVNQLSTLIDDDRLGGDFFSKLHINLGTNMIRFSPELFFVQNGEQETYQNISNVGQSLVERKIRLNYAGINLPLSIFIPFAKGAVDSGIELFGSGFADYALDGTFTDGGGAEQPLDFGAALSNKIDWGFSAGAGIMFDGFVIRSGFDRGLNEINFITAANAGGTTQYNVKNSGFYATLGYIGTLGN